MWAKESFTFYVPSLHNLLGYERRGTNFGSSDQRQSSIIIVLVVQYMWYVLEEGEPNHEALDL